MIRVEIRIPDTLSELRDRVQKTLDVIYEKLIEVTSANLYSERELRRLRPYSRVRPLETSPLVHKRTGKLQSAIKKEMVSDTYGRITLDTKKSPHINYVYHGTRRMIPRPFVDEALKRAENEIRRIWEND